jgi:CubicO group peptidase (beta-lactamase class C family)
MMTYEQLDAIADSVIPTLGVLALLLPWLPMYRASFPAWKRILCTLLGVAAAYAGMYLDKLTGAWPAMSLDYSTHSAVCVALLIALGHLSRRWLIGSVAIGVAYAALMLYQRYHTLVDILTTAIPIGVVVWLIWRGVGAGRPFGKAATTAVLVVAALFASPPAPALDSPRADIDNIFRKWAVADSPGCAVGYIQNGAPEVIRYYGLADLEHNVPIDASTLFEAGSVSKQFTAASILRLAEQGKLALTDDVRKFIPELPDYGSRITIDHLINHTSGLRDWGEVEAIAGWPRTSRVYTLTDVLDIAARQKKLNYTPGSAYSYTNTGYNLLAIIVQRVSGDSLAQFSRKQFFAPLGMAHTQWRDDFRRVVKNRAIAYSAIKGGYEQQMPFESAYGNGGMITTISDLLRWNEAFSAGKLGPFITKELQRQSTLNDGNQIAYARGLFVQTYNGVREIAHSGSTAGYRAWLGRYPDSGLSIALLCNASDANNTELAHAVANVLLRRTAPATGDSPKPQAQKGGWNPGAADLQKLAGRYTSDEALATYQISVKGKDLIAIPTGRPSAAVTLTPAARDTFQMMITDIPGSVHFTRSSNGDVESFEVATPRVYALPFRRAQ